MAIPATYGGTTTALASYDWKDLISAAGYKTFYPMKTQSAGGVQYLLSPRAIDAPTESTEDLVDGWWHDYTGGGAAVELNFDFAFAIPTIVAAATAFAQYTIYKATNNTFNVQLTLYHVDRDTSAETQIGQTASVTHDTNPAAYNFRETLQIAMTVKKFKIGDKLRLEVIISGTGNGKIYLDPTNLNAALTDRGSRTIGTDFILDVPFKIDI